MFYMYLIMILIVVLSVLNEFLIKNYMAALVYYFLGVCTAG